MAIEKNPRKTFPALRCTMGDWVYYITYMRFSDISHWIIKTDQIHKSRRLRDMIQRELTPRATPIADYLIEQKEHFFNAIVVGVYGGTPQWYPIDVHDSPVVGSPDLDEDARRSIGLLVLGGGEQLFAIDGQHRVEAIKQALKRQPELGNNELGVVFVAHQTSLKGQTRTRRLFSTLNRYAKPVSKGEIVALDEDDAFAIVTRRLVEEFPLLKSGLKKDEPGFVAFNKTTPLHRTDQTSLTSILTLYEIVRTIHVPILNILTREQKTVLRRLRIRRPADPILDAMYSEQTRYWELLKNYVPGYEELFGSKAKQKVAAKYRKEGGYLMFWPIGQQAFARALRIMIDRDVKMEDAVEVLSSIPMKLNEPPWQYVLWNPNTKRINSKVSNLLPEAICLHYVGHESRREDYNLLEEYRKTIGNSEATLPIPKNLIP